ncbi:MAG: hypothetical protein J0M04_17765 [Verrucomicrobia bacterium]|nr:hypothetical protein [Verrucomicrobiota bacterium]
MKVYLSIAMIGMAAPQGANALDDARLRMMEDWFGTAPENRGPVPRELGQLSPADAKETAVAKDAVWAAYRKGALKLGWDTQIAAMPPTLEALKQMPEAERPKLAPSKMEAGDKSMPYFLVAKGTKPEKGWPLIISLHGGGGNAGAEGPHAWPVNTREWQTQLALFERIYPGDALYFIPRMADDREGRWWYDYCQTMYDDFIRRAVLFREVDPNRIYVMGISEGGYAAYRLPANQPDRWAAAGAMAAAEPLDTSPPENLIHTAFRCDIGEKDTMFDRIGLARNYFEKLDAMAKEHTGCYIHHFGEQAGKGHGIDYQPCPEWIVKHRREPAPKRIVWNVQELHHTLHRHNWWLELADRPAKPPVKLTGLIDGNTIVLTSNPPDTRLRLALDDRLVDLDQPVTITLNGAVVHREKIPRKLESMIRTTVERGDPEMIFCATIDVPAAPK